MNKVNLQRFMLAARAQTYAGASGQTTTLLPGSVQYEYREEHYLYRDIYYIGNAIFSGIEIIIDKGQPVWSMSYFGDFSGMSEEQADSLLRTALIDLQQETRIYKKVAKDYGDFSYVCEGKGSIDKLSGLETISVKGQPIYTFSYQGGYIG